MPTLRGCATWPEALAAALSELAHMDKQHRMSSASFGTFAQSVGGGHYYSLHVCYELGNTQTALNPHPQTPQHRQDMVVRAFQDAVVITTRDRDEN